jgi:signal transduction histidine kinase
MRSFLGVPIVATGDVVGAFYLTDKEGAPEFDAEDQRLIELLAAHAAVALEHAALFERSREATLLEERERMARELHDAMAQALFSLNLTAETAAGLVREDPDAAEAQIRTVQELARGVMAELRTLVRDLQPVELARDGLAPALTQHVELLRRAHRAEITLEVEGRRRLAPATEREALRVAQEAIGNSLRHAGAARIAVRLALGPPGLVLRVADDGAGFDLDAPPLRGRRLGLASMRERAAALGGRLAIRTSPGRGTVVELEVPDA